MPSYRSHSSSTASPRLARLWGQRSTSPTRMGRLAATVETLVETLVLLPLSVQAQFLLLRASLQTSTAHFKRTMPREALAVHMPRMDAAV